MNMRASILFSLLFISSFAAEAIRVVPVRPSPESETVLLKIVFPSEYENKRKQPIGVQMRLEGFPLGTITQLDRKEQIYGDPKGQSIHVIVDDRPYEAYYQSATDSFDENRIFYDKILNFDLQYKLSPGQHIIRTFPCRSYGESLKGRGCFDSVAFYLLDKKRDGDLNVDLTAPYLTYNEPQGSYPEDKASPLLLDFYLTNVVLSRDGYKVRLSIDGKLEGILTQWVPYYIYGLAKGRHTIQLELIDSSDKIVPGFFNDVQREIIID